MELRPREKDKAIAETHRETCNTPGGAPFGHPGAPRYRVFVPRPRHSGRHVFRRYERRRRRTPYQRRLL